VGVVLWLLLVVPLAAIGAAQWTWVSAFARDFVRWLPHPEVAGGFRLPAGLAIGAALILVFSTLGWFAASLILAKTELHESPGFRIGLAMVLAVCLAGYVGMLGLTAGWLERSFLIGITATLGLLSVVLLVFSGTARHAATIRVRFGRPGALTLACWLVASLVVAWVGLHAALSPVTEWDAIIYHAGAAKLWFLEAPNPPLVYGPSVGIEISANYPPLFPASGVVYDIVIGSFQDIYLRLASPLVLAALLLLIHGYARWRIGSRGAAWAVVLVIGAPLIVLYGTWATGYMLLTALWLIVVVLCDLAWTTHKLRSWVAAGVLAGLAILTHFYGLPVLAVGPLALLLGRPSRTNLIGAALFVCVAFAVASPWLIRNTVLLGDPLYPVPLPFFHPIGLAEPLWTASQAEIRNNALGQWQGTGFSLYGQQLMTVLFDRHLLPVGLLFGIGAAAWQTRRGDRWALYFLAVIGVLVATIVAPGWFWLRALTPVIPLAALPTARGIVYLAHGELARHWRHGNLARVMMRSSWATVFTISSVVGVSLAISGPNQDTWTTLIYGSQHDMMAPVRNLGSDSAALYNVFGGDYLSWTWLNTNLINGGRVATLDNRLYYFDRPQDIFYLDGSESTPLFHLGTPDDAQSFLASHGVRFVMVPGWAASAGAARHPALDLLPLISMLGDQNFPIAAAFAGIYAVPTLIYAVGKYAAPVQLGVFPGIKAGIPSGSFVLLAGDTSPRVVVPVLNSGPTSLVFLYRPRGAGALIVNRWDASRGAWVYGVFDSASIRGDMSSWQRAEVTLPETSGYVTFGLYAAGGDVEIQDLGARNPTQPIVLIGHGTSQPDGSYTLASKDTLDRILVPRIGTSPALMTFQYRAHGSGYFDLNYHDVSIDQWSTLVSTPVADQVGWVTVAIPITTQIDSPPFGEYAIFDNGPDLEIREVTVSTDPVVVSPVAHDPGTDFIFPAGSASGRVLVPMQAGLGAVVTVRFVDTPGSFGLNVLDPFNSSGWQFGSTVLRSGTGALKTVTVSLPPGPARVIEIGPAMYSGALLVRDVSVTLGPLRPYPQTAPPHISCGAFAEGCTVDSN
jgi:4-amino-4-deoxy-L-arabinose transferase-like glycosyltransferase